MFGKLVQELEGVRRLVLSIRGENGQYVLTRDQVLAILRQYGTLLDFIQRLLEERKRVESPETQHWLDGLGVEKTKGYLN